ncbi:MAG: type I restriction enzyme HsdR N-terminal domain-containing protein [Nitrospirae bacterium]|nr:type I restriction enzyme HsdR N-terminal domain-containing protein [Nitrospirota bacterium]
MEDESVIREKKIQSILEQELEDGESLAAEARKVVSYLLVEKKGYLPEDIEKRVVFEVKLGQETMYSSVDFLISISGKKAMVIKCAAGSLDSRERQAVAIARLIGSPPVPIAVVADPVNVEVLDVATGKVVGEGFGAIPVRDRIIRMLSESSSQPLPLDRIEKEKRILLAFDAIRCCVPQGADGGVSIKGPVAREE